MTFLFILLESEKGRPRKEQRVSKKENKRAKEQKSGRGGAGTHELKQEQKQRNTNKEANETIYWNFILKKCVYLIIRMIQFKA